MRDVGNKSSGKAKTSKRVPLTKEQVTILLNVRSVLKARITYRELECGKLLALGHFAKDIAALLHISVRTVEYYTKTLKNKCRCRSRWRLISYLRANLPMFKV